MRSTPPHDARESDGPRPASAGWRLALAGLLAAALITAVLLLPTRQWLLLALDWTDGLGASGALLFIPIYVLATVLLLPGLILTLGAGFVFGLWLGTLLVSISSTLGAAAAFLLGRTVARRWIEARVRRHRRFAAIDEAVGREGFKIVLLTRLSPIFPFNVQNYAYGLTRVGFAKYVLASWIGMLPGTVMYVYLGSAAESLASLAARAGDTGAASAARTGTNGGLAQQLLVGVGLLATIAVTVLITRIARRSLSQEIGEQEADPSRELGRGGNGIPER
ncbi:MAG: TVP38/TMEM64 family protein [Acidobacteriota bacterium]|nr:MAG: TVP38/TMEM64 family protein [Acidobacteriota bacterium]